ncbi:CIC11C00000000052 [Sungouiella intermedia]|uniref:DASH complex subunit DAD4 n=1 Tax=Sungouiella intermedia TaxID=45354 RepID=A0A1L0BQ00_9ASCO|nr:CIC11C00000000052 [[Candida] intermedia]
MSNKLAMDNPHEQVQVALLSRIINNMKTLNDSVHDMNLCLNEISNKNKDTEVLSQMWANYAQSADYNLDATGQKREPL